MARPALNRTDRRLLDILQRDGRLTNLELAGRVNLSPSACLRRVRALEESGVIRGYAALVDPGKVGLGLLAFVTVKLEKRGRMPTDTFAKAVKDWPEVVGCHSMTGDMDYLLRVQRRGPRALLALRDGLAAQAARRARREVELRPRGSEGNDRAAPLPTGWHEFRVTSERFGHPAETFRNLFSILGPFARQ